MRKLEYLSPTSIMSFRKDPKKFYGDYLADNRAPRQEQTGAMAVGSAFDAAVKSSLVKDLFGESSGKFDFETLLAAQTNPNIREFARAAGAEVMKAYRYSGAYGDLILEMERSKRAPRFEYTATSKISAPTVTGSDPGGVLLLVGGVPLLGKPDADFVDSGGNDVILDWKVNGYCSKSAKSPEAGYAICRDGWDPSIFKNSRSHRASHADFVGSTGLGVRYNTGRYLEQVSEDWATQLAIYGWLGGKQVGEESICWIEQIACDNSKGFPVPLMRVASHRCKVSRVFQENLYRDCVSIWSIIQSGWIFRDMSEDASRSVQEVMDRGVVVDEDSAFFSENK